MATARNTLAVAIKLDGTAQAKKDFEDVGKAGEKAFAAIARAADRVAPGLGGRLQGALRGIRTQLIALQAAGARLAQSFSTFTLAAQTFGRSVQSTAARIGVFTAAIGGAVAAVALFAKRSADEAEQITGQAEALGISTEAYQTFQAAVTQAGLSQEQFDQILSRFVTNAAAAGDAAAGAADDTDKLAQSIRQVTVTAEDGSQKLITVRGTSEALAKSIKTVGTSTQGTEKDLVAFAKRIESLGEAERLAAVRAEGFTRNATQVVRAMLAIARDADPAARAINKVLEPTSDADLTALLKVDAAFDRLFLNLTRIRRQIGAVFGPAVAELINGIADAIFNNADAIRAFAKDVADRAIVVIRDLFALLRGDDAAVQNKGLITFRDTLISIGVQAREVIFNVIVPGFQQLIAILNQVAGVINSVFGTSLSGEGLAIAAVILQVTGAFQVLLSILALGAAALQLFGGALNLLLVVLRPLAFALGFVGAALASLLGLPAAVGVAIVAAIGLAAAATFIYWEEIKQGAASAWAYASLQVEAFANKTAQIFSQGTLDAAWQSIKDSSQAAFAYAALQAEAFINKTREILNTGGFLNGWIAAFENVFSTIQGLASRFASSLVSTIGRAIDGIISAVGRAIAAFQRLFSAQARARTSGGGGGGGSGFASGGPVFGPGTGRSDSIAAWLSNGEYVLRASIVDKLGLPLLNALNSGRFDLSGITNALSASLAPRFATGGLVEAPAGPSLRPITVNFGGQAFEMMGSDNTVRNLQKAAQTEQVSSNGRKPAWWGNR
jgi:hypothetical protein